ncbi:MAG: cytochrome c3 family protein [Candidatus Kapabacteria bacterium]|jgi:formate-dependent nitrite reductase cytochrome c552 subunit|nr:cytochrome c3 family protein [Candidatus Kapabacteria bacterium]
MEILKKFSMLLLIVASSLVLWNCEGPAGKDGIAGKDGTDGNATCGECHSDAQTDVNLKFNQYDLSMHNTGVVYADEAGRANCASCHTGDGFVEALKTGTPATSNGTSKIDCKTCHPIHDKYAKADFAVRVTAPVKLFITDAEYDFKTGNICATCHQGRKFNQPDTAEVFVFKTTGSTTYNRYGPHYGTPANVFAMKGPFPITGPEAIPTTNVHANLAQGCVTCHMGKLSTNPAAGGHTFQMAAAELIEVEACKTCHTADDLKLTPKSKEVAAMLKETRDTLIARGWLDISQTVGHDGGYQILGEYIAQSKTGVRFTKEELQVTLNYLFLAKDRSMGAHNPRYVYALVKNGLEKLKQ